MKVTFKADKADAFVSKNDIEGLKSSVLKAREALVNKSGAGIDFVGLVDLPVNYDKEEFKRIKAAAEKIKSDSDVLIVIGIGGSYLGARAAI
ncbi:MAG: glucose-6-phosphate isomerase, partial [Lachnospiraceae bacterium]|nr:glucose-6-phosphate isomerase [Lachnospiraceae bacterium]